MTVSTTTLRGGPYSGNGSTTAFSTGFAFSDNSEVQVILYDTSGSPTVQTITTHYTLSGAGTGNAGTVTMVTAPASGETLVVRLNVPLTQAQDYQNNAKFPNELTEAAFDKLTRIVQQQEEKLDRVLKMTGLTTISDLEIPVPEAGKALVGNSGGTGYTNATITASDSIVVLDEDNMASDSATAVPSQQSTKAYVDTQVAAGASSVLISSTDLTSTGIIALPADYVMYELIVIGAYSNTTNTGAIIQVSTDGVTFDTGASDYYEEGTGNSSRLGVITMKNNSDYTSGNRVFNHMKIIGARDSNEYTTMFANYAYAGSTTSITEPTLLTYGERKARQADTHIKITPSAGTFAGGTAYLIGYPSS